MGFGAKHVSTALRARPIQRLYKLHRVSDALYDHLSRKRVYVCMQLRESKVKMPLKACRKRKKEIEIERDRKSTRPCMA
jgi:hypothetical protein